MKQKIDINALSDKQLLLLDKLLSEKEKKAKLGIFKKRKFSYFLISSVKTIVLRS